MAGRGGGKGMKGGGGNGPTGKTKLHSINAGKSGHPVGGKGTKLGGKAY